MKRIAGLTLFTVGLVVSLVLAILVLAGKPTEGDLHFYSRLAALSITIGITPMVWGLGFMLMPGNKTMMDWIEE